MNELTERLRQEFHDKETREIYADDFLNSYLATQIKVLREEAGWTQAELADRAGVKRERIAVLEDVNHSSWTASVLKRLARAFDMRLSIKFESFGTFLNEFENFNHESLLRLPFEEDPAFQEGPRNAPGGTVEHPTSMSGPNGNDPLTRHNAFDEGQTARVLSFSGHQVGRGGARELQASSQAKSERSLGSANDMYSERRRA